MRHRRITFVVATALAALTCGGHAQSLDDAFAHGHVDGEVRLYDFNRIYGTPSVPDASALSGALLLNAQTGTFGGGFSLGASLLTANAFGTHSGTPAKIDTTLMGPHNSVSALGQAYAQYQSGSALLRLGDQYLNTPWMGSSDSRVLPASYQAVSAVFTPAKDWQVVALRSWGWESRTSDDYHFDNLYYPPTYRDDSMYGGLGGLSAGARAARGTWTLGATWAEGGFKAQAWYYDFIGIAHLGYVDGSYTYMTDSGFDPFVAAQYVGESGGSGSVLVENSAKLFGIGGSKVKTSGWGADVGVNIPHGKFDVAYNKIASASGAIGNGALISPYTAGYASDPLYTTSMIRGLVELGPGHAWKAKFTYNLIDDRLQLVTAYAKYATLLRGDSHDVYLDLTYRLDSVLKGLSLRDRWERSSGGFGANPGNRSFTYNRLMIAYKF